MRNRTSAPACNRSAICPWKRSSSTPARPIAPASLRPALVLVWSSFPGSIASRPHAMNRYAMRPASELYLAQGRWDPVEQSAQQLTSQPHGLVEGQVLRARGLLARRDFAGARQLLDTLIAQQPQAL